MFMKLNIVGFSLSMYMGKISTIKNKPKNNGSRIENKVNKNKERERK